MSRLPGLRFMFSLAETLHMDVDQVMNMPSKRLLYWRAYFNIKESEHKMKQAEADVKARTLRRGR
jgi:hypothetical protein